MKRILIAIIVLLVVSLNDAGSNENSTENEFVKARETLELSDLISKPRTVLKAILKMGDTTSTSVKPPTTISIEKAEETTSVKPPTTILDEKFEETTLTSIKPSTTISAKDSKETTLMMKQSHTEVKANPMKRPSFMQTASDDCPSFANVDRLTQTHFSDALTNPCRFDRIQRPRAGENKPVTVYTRAYVYFLQNLHAYDLQFKVQALLMLRYKDERLNFKGIGSNRTEPIVGEEALRKKLWVPHIFFANEKDSGILGTYEKDILTSVSSDGTVLISTRFQATLFCSMDLRKFPFDQQECKTVIESWTYNATDLTLKWEDGNPVKMGPDQHLTEYSVINFYVNETMINADFAAQSGNYSSLSFTVALKREIGFYMYDYFLPSMMIIAISWASFWLQADQTAPRIMLGTTTMLTFITLASAQDKSLPKVSYIKASEIWSMGCTAFIFMSLVEFAFVNTIWRRKDQALLKKANARSILKHTFNIRSGKTGSGESTPGKIPKSFSSENMGNITNNNKETSPKFSVGNKIISKDLEAPAITIENPDSMAPQNLGFDFENDPLREYHDTFTTMTPQEISLWIDKKARFVFPCAFILFNIFYWTFVGIYRN